MPTKLKHLVITKVALVDEGACSAAHIKLYKRKEGGIYTMELEEVLKLIPEDQREAAKAAIEKAKADAAKAASVKAADDAEDAIDGGLDDAMENPDGTPKKDTKKKSVAKVAAKIKGLNAEITKLKGATTTKTEDELLKSVDPAIRAILEKAKNQAAAAEAAVLKMKDETDTQESLAKAKELPNIGAKSEDLAKSFKALKKLDEKVFNDVFDVLKSANALIADGNPLGELGASGVAVDDVALTKAADVAWTAIEKKADDIKKTANCSKEQAISKAITANPELYKQYLNNLK